MIVRIRPFLLVPLPTRKQGFLGYCQQASEDIFRDTDTKNSIFYAKCYRLLQLENNSSKDLGMFWHNKSLITIFGHKHKIKNFIKNLIFLIKKYLE